MRKIRNFLCFFICSFHLNCPTTEEQITDRQVLLGVTQKVSSNSKHTLLPPLRTKDEIFAFRLSMPKVADLNSLNLRQTSKLPH